MMESSISQEVLQVISLMGNGDRITWMSGRNIRRGFAYDTPSAGKIENEENPQFHIFRGTGLLCRIILNLLGRNAYWRKESVGGGEMATHV